MNDNVPGIKEKEIIKAARRIFARFGFSKTTMEDIAAEMDMGKASLYYYFPTKESLFHAAVQQEQEEFLSRLNIILAEKNKAEDKLRTFIEERLAFFKELITLGTLTYKEVSGKHITKKLYQEFGEKEIAIIKNIIADGKRKGEFDSCASSAHAILLVHIIQGLRIRTIQGSDSAAIDSTNYKELKNDMMMTIDIFIKAIKNNGRES